MLAPVRRRSTRAATGRWRRHRRGARAPATVLVRCRPGGDRAAAVAAVVRSLDLPAPSRAERGRGGDDPRGLRRRGPRRGGGADRDEPERGGGGAHRHARGRVAFSGFAPGFGYLVGGDPGLHVPRRPSPAVPRCRPGRSALAGRVQRRSTRATSPGGWQLIGRTGVDGVGPRPPTRPRCCAPGTRVTLRGGLRSVKPGTGGGSRPGRWPRVQDLGRPGQADLGVRTSGAADRARPAAGQPAGRPTPRARPRWRSPSGGPAAARARRPARGARGAPAPPVPMQRGRARGIGYDASSGCPTAPLVALGAPRRGLRTLRGGARRAGACRRCSGSRGHRRSWRGSGPRARRPGDAAAGRARRRPPVPGCRPRAGRRRPATTCSCCGILPGPRDGLVRRRRAAGAVRGPPYDGRPADSNRVGMRLRRAARWSAVDEGELPPRGDGRRVRCRCRRRRAADAVPRRPPGDGRLPGDRGGAHAGRGSRGPGPPRGSGSGSG